ncbi:MAG: hypothetical protein HY689_13855 [Chloroflexi bacterium]|nr:hypothetical protein [Chloroflexota bacterium]
MIQRQHLLDIHQPVLEQRDYGRAIAKGNGMVEVEKRGQPEQIHQMPR